MMDEKRKNNIITDRIAELMDIHFGLKCNFSPSTFDDSLTGQPYELSGTELYQMLMLIEEEYEIYFRIDDIRQYGFNTINNIIDMMLIFR